MTHARPDALILLGHGSPDPDWSIPLEATAARVRQRVTTPVATATLEHGRPLADAVRELAAAGHRHITVAPLFLSAGGKHLKRDVPALVAALQASLPDLTLRLVPGALGTDDVVLDAFADAAVRLAGLAAS